MPISWMPKRRTLEQDIVEEEARLKALRGKPVWQPPTAQEPLAPEQPQPVVGEFPQPTISRDWMPQMPTPQAPPTLLPSLPTITPAEVPKEEPIEIPFWQRALEVFAAPFVWTEENVIKPGLSLTGTALGFVPEVVRQPGEDYWEWKKRSWGGWKAPGFNMDVPWSDEPWRIDLKGVMELAPWLLIPGAGQVGGGVRVARGVAGIVGKFGKAGRALGTAVEYSPWGLVEKTAGVAMKGAVGVAGRAVGRTQAKIGERLVGKIPEPVPPSPAVAKLTKFFDESVVPARKEFEKQLPQLRARQYKAVDEIWAKVRKGELTATEGTVLAEKATAGGIKAGFAVGPSVGIVDRAALSIPREYQVYQGVGKGRTSNWFTTNFDEATFYARRQTKGPEGVEPVIRIWDKRAIERRLAPKAKFSDLLEEGSRIEYSYTGLNKIPYQEFSLTAGISQFTAKEADELLGIIVKASEDGLVARDSTLALQELFLKGGLPEPRHFREFAKVYGNDFAKAVKKLVSLKRSTWEQILDAANLPRAVLASGDLSATFRQGLILLLTHPEKAPRAFWRQLKGFWSEKITLEMDDVLRTNPLYREAVENGVEFTAIRRGAQMAAKEEPFASNIAQHIPMVRRSERAFTTFLNEMRMSSYEAAHGAMVAQGASAAEMKLMGRFINLASGRGTLPANLDRYAPVLNTVLFSARYQMSTLQLPRQIGRMLLSKNPYMRKEAAKALITFVGGGASLVALLQSTGRGKVEIDPRSGDFGKVVIGKTRLDIWRGYVQYARFVAQILTGERKSAYGNMSKAQRSEIVSRFLQSKASPAFGLMVDLLKGESYMGEPLFNETTGFIKTARERLLPLALQDVIDSMEQSGTSGLWTAAPATLGIGVLTYVNDYVRIKERIARQLGFQTWDEIDPKTQRMIQNTNTELQIASIEFDRQVMGTAWGDWHLAGDAIEDVFRGNVDMATAQYRASVDPNKGVIFREKVSDAFTARRGGYDARNKEARFEDIVRRNETKDTAEAMVGLGPEQMAIRIYNDALWGDDMYDEFGDYRFDEAEIRKQQLRQQLGEEMFNYVEEFKGMKYETFPPEYQELARAKVVLRPYWQVQDRADRLFGKPKTEWQQRRIDRVVSRMRKMMRRQNPEMELAYQKFYVRS